MKRVYRVPVYVVFDDEATDFAEPVFDYDELTAYLEEALIVDVNVTDFGNPYGADSALFFRDEIEQLFPFEINKVLAKSEPDIPGDDD